MNFYIGIDIGGTNTKIALVDQNGAYSSLSRVYYNSDGLTIEQLIQKITADVERLLKTNQKTMFGIGVSCPGLQMQNGKGTLFSVNMSVLNNFDLKGYFEKRFNLPVVVTNDLVAHSLTESLFGVGKGITRVLCVSLGTGIGHTYIYQGIPQLTINGTSGDSGRIIIDPVTNLMDSSGVVGSAEAMCGVKAIEILGKEYYSNQEEYSAEEIITKAREDNDPNAIKILTIIAKRLTLLLINLSMIYFPDVISITGGQTESGLFFIEECQREFDRRTLSFFNQMGECFGKEQKIRILKSEAGGLAGLIGSIVPLLNEKRLK